MVIRCLHILPSKLVKISNIIDYLLLFVAEATMDAKEKIELRLSEMLSGLGLDLQTPLPRL